MNVDVGAVVHATETRLFAGDATQGITGCSIDSRSVAPGDLFVAFPGERVDGNDFVCAAAQAGASCVAMTREPTQAEQAELTKLGCAILVPSTAQPSQERFLLALASYWRSLHEHWIVVGVTGSVGKTTTKEMLAAALRTRYRVHATRANLNSMIGVPLTLLSATDDDQVVVVEMGMNHQGELWRQSQAIRPNLAVITNIGTSHIGNLGSREGIARAKAEILAGIAPSALVSGGGKRLFMRHEEDFRELIETEFTRQRGIAVSYVGCAAANELRAERIVVDDDGCAQFCVCYADGYTQPASLLHPGAHIVPDALFALAVADYLHCDRTESIHAVEQVQPSAMRLEVYRHAGKPCILDDSYNASPASIAGALDLLSSMECAGRRIAVLGEMGELGERAEQLHQLVGAYLAAKHIDMFVAIGSQLAEALVEGATTMGMSTDAIELFPDVSSALQALRPVFVHDDIVLVKASRAAGLDSFVQGVLA